jgi:hypothetical protein
VWFEHLNGEQGVTPANRLPILRKNVGASENNNGTSHQVGLGKLLRYDSTRLLLYIRENGIEEAVATPEDKAIAALYPDASLIWIDAATGAPLIPAGHTNPVALVLGVTPIAVTGQSSQFDFFHEWGLDAAGNVYSGHKNKILRWAKTGTDTWASTPTCCWTEPTVGATDCNGNALDDSSSGDGNQSIRWREFRVTGSGTNTVLFCGGGTWRMDNHTQIFCTTNGLDFFPVGRLNSRDNGATKTEYSLGGQASSIIKYGWDPQRPNLLTVYTGHYPGTGYGARPSRHQSDPDNPSHIISPFSYTTNDQVFVLDREETATNNQPAFNWEAAGKDGLPQIIPIDGEQYYDGNWSCNLDGNGSLDYIVSYSMPSWDNQYGQLSGTNYHKPGWIGVHRLDGSISPNSAWKMNCTEADIANSDNGGIGNDWGYCGDITLVPDTNAPANLKKATIYWSGGAYGFGIFTIQNVAAAINAQPPASITVNELDPISIEVGVTGSPNTYQWTRNGVPLDGAKTNVLDGSLYYPPTVIQGVKKTKLFIKQSRAGDTGTYRLTIINPLSGTTNSSDVNVTVNPDTNAPNVIAAGSMGNASGGGTTVDVQFDKVVDLGGADPVADPGTARNTANYTFVSPGGATVTSAEIRKSGKAVRLTVNNLLPATSFTLKVAGVRNYTRAANTAIPAAGQTVSGVVQADFTTTEDILANNALLSGITYTLGPGEYEAESGGQDIWGSGDNFHFAYKQVTGNFDVMVQVAAEDTSLPGNRNGIMLRETLDPASRFAYVTWNPGNIAGFHVRQTEATDPFWANPQNNWAPLGPPPNVWLRLQRQGALTSAFVSPDGHTWYAFGTAGTNVFTDPAYLGLATCNGGNTTTRGFTKYANYGTASELRIINVNGVLTLSWTGPGTLESSTVSVSGPYSNAASQSNPQTVTPSGTQRFFRLKQ